MSSSAASPQLHCKASHQRENLPHQLLHELTCLVPSGSAEQQALQQQALHQAALHQHSLQHHNDHHTQQQPCPSDGAQHLFAFRSHRSTHNRVAKLDFMEGESPSGLHTANICAGDEEGQAGCSNEFHTLSGTVQCDSSCHKLDALQDTDVADSKMVDKHILISSTDKGLNHTAYSSLMTEDASEKVEVAKDCHPLKDRSIDCRNWSKNGNLRPKCRGAEFCNDDEIDLGASATREESIRGLKAGLIHVAHKMPKNAHAHFILGLMYQRLEQPAKAASSFLKVDEILKKSEVEFGQSRSQLLSIVQCHYAMTMLQARVVGNVHLGTDLESSDAEGWIKILKLAVETDPCYSLVWNMLGLVFFQIGQTEIAVSIFRSLLYAVPNCLDAFANLGVAYLHRGHLANAARCLQSLLEKDSAYPGGLLNYATLLLHQYGSSFSGTGATGDGALGERAAGIAQKCLRAALNLNPRAGHLWASLSASYSVMCDSFNATKCLEQAYKLEPTRLSIRYAVAMQRVHECQNNSAGSEGLTWAANEIVSILRVGDPATIQPHVARAGLAKVLRLQDDIVAAFEGDEIHSRQTKARAYHTLQQAVEANPHDPMQWQQLGLYALCTLQFRLAQSCFKMAIAQRQTCGEIWSNLGISLQLSEELSLAEEIYQKALSLVPREKAHTVLSNLGNLYRQQRRFADARAAFQKALNLCPNYAPACNNLGLLLVMEGKLDEAMKMFDCALQFDAHFDAAKSNRMKAQVLVRARGIKATSNAGGDKEPSMSDCSKYDCTENCSPLRKQSGTNSVHFVDE